MKTPDPLKRLFTVSLIAGALWFPGTAAANDYGYLRAMTRNMYIGADIFRIAEAQSPEEVPFLAAQVLATLLESSPAERIDRMASEIERTRPHVIGLQEAMWIRQQSPSDAIFGGTLPAEDTLFDFIAMLEASLAARGLDYQVVAVLENLDVELPVIVGLDDDGNPIFIDVRVTDRIAVLAKAGVSTANVFQKHYEVRAMLPLAGQNLDFLRGYIGLDAWVHGKKFTFVNTHLEVDLPGPGLQIQAAQAAELLTVAGTLVDPLVIVGDFNSGPQHPLVTNGVPSPYAQFLAAGLIDTWAVRHFERRSRGFTCCQDEDLRNFPSALDRRIDFVWLANGGRPSASLAIRVGAHPLERTAAGLWPSDHAGVVTKMFVELED